MYKDVLEYSISWLLLNHMAGLTVQSKPLLKYFTQSVIYKHTKLSRLQTVIETLRPCLHGVGDPGLVG